MAIWFTSDEHHGHSNIIEYSKRPFRDAAEMTEELVRRHNAVVRDGDVVWHLGDFALDERIVPKVLSRLLGTHRLVMGNHDKCHPSRSRSRKFLAAYERWGFSGIFERVEVSGFAVCHLPYAGDHTEEERFSRWRPADEGRWLLHGHVHEAWRVRGRQINVGVDQWAYAPVSLDELLAIRSAGFDSSGLPRRDPGPGTLDGEPAEG